MNTFVPIICPGDFRVPPHFANMYHKEGIDVRDYTICEYCINNCVEEPLRSNNKLIRVNMEEHSDDPFCTFSCDCDKDHVRLQIGIYTWGKYPCRTCIDTGVVPAGGGIYCEECDKMFASNARYCSICSIKKGCCGCGQHLADADHSYLRTYFCKALGLPLNGIMVSLDLVLYNVAKNRIASTLEGYVKHPLMIDKTGDKNNRSLSYYSRIQEERIEEDDVEDELPEPTLDELLDTGEFGIDEDGYKEFLLHELRKKNPYL